MRLQTFVLKLYFALLNAFIINKYKHLELRPLYFCSHAVRHKLLQTDEWPALQCADTEVVDCKEHSDILQKEFPAAFQVKKYQHWLCGQTPGMDICRVSPHDPQLYICF